MPQIVEGNAGNRDFESMPGAVCSAIITMPTVGFGDITPVTVVGKLITAALVLVGSNQWSFATRNAVGVSCRSRRRMELMYHAEVISTCGDWRIRRRAGRDDRAL